MSFRTTSTDISFRLAFLFYPLRVKKKKRDEILIVGNKEELRREMEERGMGLEISCFSLVGNRGDQTNP